MRGVRWFRFSNVFKRWVIDTSYVQTKTGLLRYKVGSFSVKRGKVFRIIHTHSEFKQIKEDRIENRL